MLSEDQIRELAKHLERRMGGLDRNMLPYGDPAGKDVLVFGSGLGNEVVWAARHQAKSVIGIDLAKVPPEPLAMAMAESGLADYHDYEIRQQNVHDLALTRERFDLIVSYGVFEHVFDLKGVLEALRRLLRPTAASRSMQTDCGIPRSAVIPEPRCGSTYGSRRRRSRPSMRGTG